MTVIVSLGHWKLIGGKREQKSGVLGQASSLVLLLLVFMVSSERNICKHMEFCTLEQCLLNVALGGLLRHLLWLLQAGFSSSLLFLLAVPEFSF